MDLPKYFELHDGKQYYSVGDRVYGTLSFSEEGVEVSYKFNDGSRPYEDSRSFNSCQAAKSFAIKFAREMTKAIKKNSVPTLGMFRSF